jgi:hypothetical protein
METDDKIVNVDDNYQDPRFVQPLPVIFTSICVHLR